MAIIIIDFINQLNWLQISFVMTTAIIEVNYFNLNFRKFHLNLNLETFFFSNLKFFLILNEGRADLKKKKNLIILLNNFLILIYFI
jgi:hypothetical protein